MNIYQMWKNKQLNDNIKDISSRNFIARQISMAFDFMHDCLVDRNLDGNRFCDRHGDGFHHAIRHRLFDFERNYFLDGFQYFFLNCLDHLLLHLKKRKTGLNWCEIIASDFIARMMLISRTSYGTGFGITTGTG